MTKYFRAQYKVLAWMLSLLFSCVAFNDSFHLVVSAGALSDRDPYAPFYQSRIFIGEAVPPMVITNADAFAFESDRTVFYSSESITFDDIVRLGKNISVGQQNGFISYGFRGFLLEGKASEEIRRYVGADVFASVVEKKVIDNKTIWAFSKDHTSKNIIWPKAASELSRMPAVVISGSGAKYLVSARRVGDMRERLGLIDQLLVKNPGAGLIELGTDHSDYASLKNDALDAFFKRNPMAVFLGTLEMTSLLVDSEILRNRSTIYPVESNFRTASTVDKRLAGKKINFWSVTNNEAVWPLYSKLGKTKNLQDAIVAMKEESPNPDQALNVVRVFSEQAAQLASKSVYVDVVLLVDPYSVLPSKEVINLKEARSDLSKHAPIIKVSLFDISEINLSGNTLGRLDQVTITRHLIDDKDEKARDVTASTAINMTMNAEKSLPDIAAIPNEQARPWTKADLQMVLGSIAVVEGNADVALLEELSDHTPIYGRIPFEMARNLLSPAGSLLTITITGKKLKEINKLLNKKTFAKKLYFYGLDTEKVAIGKRIVNDNNERFTLALDETALLEVFGLSRLGGLGDTYSVRAPFIEAIYVQGDLSGLVYASAPPKVTAVADTAQEIEQALTKTRTGPSFHQAIADFFTRDPADRSRLAFLFAKGRSHHVVSLDFAYVDVGLSKNFVNSHYETYQKDSALPMGRAKANPFLHLFIFAKAALEYDAPALITTLGADMKYMHTNLDEKPEKDKTKISLKLRLPWERTVMSTSSVVASPLLKSIYETKLVPHFWSHPKNLKGPRTQRIDTLLGFNVNFLNLGFNFDIGPVMAADFTRTNLNDALDFGPGINFWSKWNLFGPLELSSEITSYYLFALPKNMADNKLALAIEGTLWLRLARFYNFSISAVNDLLMATLQKNPKDFAISSIFGLTFSYTAGYFRLFG